MKVDEILSQAGSDAVVRHVFGDPIERDGVTIVPAARVLQGGGGGAGTDEGKEGSGGGFGLAARPVGAFRIEDGTVTWIPAVDVTRIAIGGQVMVAVVLMLLFRAVRKRRRR